MNYIKEINAFYVKLETQSLSMSAVALWHALMHINNRARWVKSFSVAASVVCAKGGLSVSTFKRARTELKEKGLIVHVSRGSLAPMYEIVSLVKVETVGVSRGEVINRKANNPLTFPTFSFFMDHFPSASKSVVDALYEWAERVGDALTYEALVRAVESDKKIWNYVRGILKNWQKHGLETVEEIVASEEHFRRERVEHHSGKGRTSREEILPDWFKSRRSHVG